ncbi:hypothetical protein PoB_000321400 [Plakobranchus ocellatus]|uniref:Uncharacterized protein n=1 Tax=Plakobranchus ocellatus TaxID=259542 RepID=A0AAV3Y191_9GAST|nr:hypothetical protein PoB_000321400 [Plakobranchus ocellatus]
MTPPQKNSRVKRAAAGNTLESLWRPPKAFWSLPGAAKIASEGEPRLSVELTGQHFPTKSQVDIEWTYSQQQYSSNKKNSLRLNVHTPNNGIPQRK